VRIDSADCPTPTYISYTTRRAPYAPTPPSLRGLKLSSLVSFTASSAAIRPFCCHPLLLPPSSPSAAVWTLHCPPVSAVATSIAEPLLPTSKCCRASKPILVFQDFVLEIRGLDCGERQGFLRHEQSVESQQKVLDRSEGVPTPHPITNGCVTILASKRQFAPASTAQKKRVRGAAAAAGAADYWLKEIPRC
jgi:hypothetical protein